MALRGPITRPPPLGCPPCTAADTPAMQLQGCTRGPRPLYAPRVVGGTRARSLPGSGSSPAPTPCLAATLRQQRRRRRQAGGRAVEVAAGEPGGRRRPRRLARHVTAVIWTALPPAGPAPPLAGST